MISATTQNLPYLATKKILKYKIYLSCYDNGPENFANNNLIKF